MGRVVRALKHSWNAFEKAPRDLDPTWVGGPMTGSPRQNRSPRRYMNDKSIIGSIYTRLALDVAGVEFFHCLLNDDGVAEKLVYDGLNECLSLNPNIDQSAMAFKMDAALTMFEVGHCAIIPTETTNNPIETGGYDVNAMRVGRVVGWYPRKVTVELYDDREVDKEGQPAGGGIVKQLTLPKNMVSIIENPFYSVMNEPSGTLQRLLMKLQMLDGLDEATSSGKLDLIFQLPYAVRSETKRQQAEKRRADLRDQLADDELGIGYIDVSEKVIQLNRPIENKLLSQIEYLTRELFTNLSLTPEIMNGTANRETLNNYFDRTIEPLCMSLSMEMKRKFLTKTARTQGHSIEIYKDPLKLIPIDELSEVADKLIRNAVVTANEFRPKIGYRPSKDPNANKLQNPNMPTKDQPGTDEVVPVIKEKEEPSDTGLRRIV
jgi:hypothetical protein